MFCKKCGNEIVEGARFCFECGTELDEYMIKSMEEQQPAAEQTEAIIVDSDENLEIAPTVEFGGKWPTVENAEDATEEATAEIEVSEEVSADENMDDVNTGETLTPVVCADNTEVLAAIEQLNEKLDTIIDLLKFQNRSITSNNQRIDEVENVIKSMKIVF